RWSRANGRTADLDVSEPDGGRWYAADRWEVRATWDLSRLVFDGRELRVAAAARARARARRALVDRVSALFVERERLRATRPHTAEMQRAASIALARTNALLDLLTGASRHPTRHE
ncbi:MAG: hypothetical protein KC503_09455, partial [Myxococcales bacterium]|nr:hypothetical protein [Myxococcales bacterium]